MSLETKITNAWQKKAAWLWLLLPLSWLYGAIIWLRRKLYQLGILTSYRAPVAVMVIGNITVGGSGKTPLIMSLVQFLQKKQVKVGVISRGYGGDINKMPALVSTQSLPSEVGDEPCLIAAITGAPIAVCPNRQQAIEMLLTNFPDIQLIIADDGLQHFALARDIEWIVVDAARGFGNKQLLPTGFLREPLSRLQDATVIYHETPESQAETDDKLIMTLVPDKLSPLMSPDRIQDSALKSYLLQNQITPPKSGDTVHAVSGIGYPKRFFETLAALGFNVIEHPFPDHHDFSLSDLQPYQHHPIIVTSKDAVKIRALIFSQLSQNGAKAEDFDLINRLWELPVTAKLSPKCYDVLKKDLAKYSMILD